jgi:hypothetical protein
MYKTMAKLARIDRETPRQAGAFFVQAKAHELDLYRVLHG